MSITLPMVLFVEVPTGTTRNKAINKLAGHISIIEACIVPTHVRVEYNRETVGEAVFNKRIAGHIGGVDYQLVQYDVTVDDDAGKLLQQGENAGLHATMLCGTEHEGRYIIPTSIAYLSLMVIQDA